MGNNWGGVDSVSHGVDGVVGNGVDSVGNNWGGVDGMSHGVDGVVGNGVDGVVDGVVRSHNNGGSVVRGVDGMGGMDDTSVTDDGVAAHVRGGGSSSETKQGGNDESLKYSLSVLTGVCWSAGLPAHLHFCSVTV